MATRKKSEAPATGEKKERRLVVALSPASAQLLRDIAAKTKLTIGELLDYLENAHLDKAIDALLIDRYRQWRDEKLQDDFLKDRMPKEATDANAQDQ